MSNRRTMYCSTKCSKEGSNQQKKEWRLKNRSKQLLYQKNAREKINSDPELLKKKREYEKQWLKKINSDPELVKKKREYEKQWRQKNKGYYQTYIKKLGQEHKEKRKEYEKQWKQKNKNHLRKLVREYARKRKKEDPYFALTVLLRGQLNQKLKVKGASKKNNKALELLGIEIKYFKKYLEHKFKPGMTWENRGKVWHIDHIIPVSILDISKEENLKFAFHYRNLQPMFAKDNIRKGNKVWIPAEKGDKLRDMDVKIRNILKRVHPEQELDFNIIAKPIDERGIGVEIIFKHSVN